ncbi:MAG TPA: methylmalonyl-CoA mutase family protein [Pseudonocardiaceae bacterium]|jgi:methylmalonyl-CoA mutase|nr:methylmalonyl-CoA mutase family protein [Pseudonocardiaceae bacterium]
MTTPPDGLDLAAEFPDVTRDDWRELVRAVLVKSGQADASDAPAPEDLLAATSYDHIPIAPLYTAADLPAGATGLPGLAPFTRGGRPEGGTLTGWDVRAWHADPDPAAANEAILADLENGVTSLWLTVGADALPVDGLPTALSEVLLDLAAVTLDAGPEHRAAAEALLALYAGRGIPASEVTGNLGIDPIGWSARSGGSTDPAEAAAFVAELAGRYPQLRGFVADGLPYHEAGGSDAEELGAAIATGVAYLRALTAAGLDATAAAAQLEFRFAVTDDQFAGIAKLRAARRLWARVAEVSGVRGAAAAQRQHAVTSPAMMTRRDPWVNMLRTTVACFAAGIGGADAVTVLPFDHAVGAPGAFSRRIARNTQSILLEESKLAGVIDPAGGSWYVESLTDSLAHQAWDVFTEIERDGGVAAQLSSGALADRLAKTWQAREERIAHRADPITGVSEFPNLAEKSLERPPAPERTGGGLPRRRYAQDFEELRDRAEAELARSGIRPAVFLATLGPVAAHTARASFASNLLQAGGFDTPTAGATSDVDGVVKAFTESGLRIACLCGTDTTYGEQAADAVAALKKAGATTVLLAGSPRTGHADEFLHRGCDALEVLRKTWQTWEAAR